MTVAAITTTARERKPGQKHGNARDPVALQRRH
jgi:hypothetical protein